GMQLKEIAGWNQVASDWEALLQLEPEGCFAAEVGERCVATTTAINYESRFGWIGMVIVDPAFRRRGIATRMVERAIQYLESVSCRCQKLDATGPGARVYEKMGFTIEYEVQRWFRDPQRAGPVKGVPNLGPLSVEALDSLADLDRSAFGASRLELLRWYCSNSCPSFLAGKEGNPLGYAVGRVGSRAWQMGPLVATETQVAQDLMAGSLAAVGSKPVIGDVVAHNHDAVRLLQSFGFERQRVLYRMFRGKNAWPGKPLQTFCLAGFEYG
ncbi:GNAT family N-acetyltransferase, partial [Acidobacteria bacterium AH-259-L09]|nr:GNAT family N-acetyltransferase [Acidobacteria bacterium AH-259-L09]